MTSTALRRLLAVAATTGVLLTGAACGSDDTTMTPTDHSSTMTDDMSPSMSPSMSESPMTDKSDGMMSESPMSDPSASMSDSMSDDMSGK